jgi:hypothetical protein
MGLPGVSPRAMAKRRFIVHGVLWLAVFIPFFSVLWSLGNRALPYWVILAMSFGVAAVVGGSAAILGWVFDQAPLPNGNSEKEHRS